MNYADRLDQNKLAIFLLHGVIEKQTYLVRNYTRKHLEKEYFADFLRKLKTKGKALSLDQVIEHHRAKEAFPPYSFVITFDDGFQNNLTVAAKVLADFNVPSTFYVSTGLIEENAMTWIDRIEFAFETLNAGQVRFPWSESVWSLNTSERKIEALNELRTVVKATPSIDVDQLVTSICQQLKMKEVYSSSDPLDQKLTWNEVKALDQHPLFTVGGHSHRHVNLEFLKDDELEQEIKTSVDLLQKKAGISSKHYSYPEGLEHCYSPRVIRVLKQHGVECCPTALNGLNNENTDLFELRRIAVI